MKQAFVCINGWHGRDEKPVEIIKETPKRYLVRTLADTTFLPGGRREPKGTEVYVPKYAIKFVEA